MALLFGVFLPAVAVIVVVGGSVSYICRRRSAAGKSLTSWRTLSGKIGGSGQLGGSEEQDERLDGETNVRDEDEESITLLPPEGTRDVCPSAEGGAGRSRLGLMLTLTCSCHSGLRPGVGGKVRV